MSEYPGDAREASRLWREREDQMAKRAKAEHTKGAGDIGEIGAPEQQPGNTAFEVGVLQALDALSARVAALEAEVKTLKGV